MSILTPFDDARKTLGLGAEEADAATIKRAYRRATTEHPPDRDPEVFRKVRDAYELLRDPWARAAELLIHPLPLIPPPAPPEVPPSPPRGATVIRLLRLAVMRADPEGWSAPPTKEMR